MTTASLLREARLRSGLTQQELASRARTTQSVIARWEAGHVRPPLETLQSLARACGLELTLGLVDRDPGEDTLIEQNLALSPAERLDQLVRTVEFARLGRATLGRAGE